MGVHAGFYTCMYSVSLELLFGERFIGGLVFPNLVKIYFLRLFKWCDYTIGKLKTSCPLISFVLMSEIVLFPC